MSRGERTKETMEEMKTNIRAFLEKYDAGYRNIASIPPFILEWLRKALKTDDVDEFFKDIKQVGHFRGILDALYDLQLYFEEEGNIF